MVKLTYCCCSILGLAPAIAHCTQNFMDNLTQHFLLCAWLCVCATVKKNEFRNLLTTKSLEAWTSNAFLQHKWYLHRVHIKQAEHIFASVDATKITLAPTNADVTVGEAVQMQCAASHDSTLDITFIWSLDGRAIDFDREREHYERVVRADLPWAQWCRTYLHMNTE